MTELQPHLVDSEIDTMAPQVDGLRQWGRGKEQPSRVSPLTGASGCWNQAALTEPFVLALPGGGSVVVKAFDIKRDPAHTLSAATR